MPIHIVRKSTGVAPRKLSPREQEAKERAAANRAAEMKARIERAVAGLRAPRKGPPPPARGHAWNERVDRAPAYR